MNTEKKVNKSVKIPMSLHDKIKKAALKKQWSFHFTVLDALKRNFK